MIGDRRVIKMLLLVVHGPLMIQCQSVKQHNETEETLRHNVYCVSKDDTDLAHYNFNAHQPSLVIFGKNVTERV